MSAGPGEGNTTTTTTTTTASDAAEEERLVDPSLYFAPAVPVGSTLIKRQSARLHLLREPSGALRWAFAKSAPLPRRAGSTTDEEYVAEIAVTADAGKTWATTFTNLGAFYL